MDKLDLLIKNNKNDAVSEKIHNRVEDTLNLILNEDYDTKTHISISTKKKSYIRKFAITAGIILILSFSIGVKYNVYAKILDLLQNFKEKGEISEQVENYSNEIKQTVYNNGYKVTLENISLDSNIMRIFYTIQSDKAGDIQPGIWGDGLKINDLSIADYGGMSFEENQLQSDDISISKNLLTLRLGSELPESFNFKWNIYNISDHEGNWDFNIDINSKKISQNTKTLDVNTENKLSIGNFTIDKVVVSPIEIILKTSQNTIDNNRINYIVIDKNDKLLPLSSNYQINSWSGSNLNERYYAFGLYKKIPNSIKIIPCEVMKKANDFNDNGIRYNIGTSDISVYNGKNGSLTIKNIEDKGDYVEVEVNIKGYLRFELLDRFGLAFEDEDNKINRSTISHVSRKVINQKLGDGEQTLIFNKMSGKDKNYFLEFNIPDGESIDNLYKVHNDKSIEVNLDK